MPATLTMNHTLEGAFSGGLRRKSQSVNFPSRPLWQRSVEAQLNELRSLKTGWDGYGSVPVKAEVAEFVVNILRQNMNANSPAPTIVPVSGGGLQIEWHQNNMDIELFVSRPYESELFVEYLDEGETIEETLEADFSVLGTIIQQL